MDTRLIVCFLALAKHRNFTRAAEELGMPQPHLSRLIRRLEDIAGARLFLRTNPLSLTDAGQTLLEESPAVLDQVGVALRRTAAASAPKRVLKVGYTALYPDLPLHHGILKFRARHPDVELDLRNIGSAQEQADMLRSGELDVGLFQFIRCDVSGLSWSRISRLSFVLAVPEDWPFPSAVPIDLANLADYPFVLSDPGYAPEIHDAQLAYCENAGFRPKVARYGGQRGELMLLVASGFGACFLFEPALRIRHDRVKQLVIANPRADLGTDCNMVWLDHNPLATTMDFVNLLTAEARFPVAVPQAGGFSLEWRKESFEAPQG